MFAELLFVSLLRLCFVEDSFKQILAEFDQPLHVQILRSKVLDQQFFHFGENFFRLLESCLDSPKF